MSNAIAASQDEPLRFLRLPQVRDRVGLSTAEIYRRMSAGTFPKPIALTKTRVAWVEPDVVEWMKAVMRAAGRSI